PIFIWDFDDGIVEWNRGCEELYGYTRAEALGKTKEKLLGTQVRNSSFNKLRETLLAQGSWSGELRQETKDGRVLVVESQMGLEALDDRRLVMESTRDITERKLWEKRQKLLLGELTHRVKNTLSVVQSIAHQTLRSSSSAENFMEHFGGRLLALDTAHSLLVESDWQGADLAALARRQLEPYISDNPDRLRIQGETVLLPADLATPFGLVLHELATNAAKYGSLTEAKGTVSLAWKVTKRNDRSILKVIWKEKNGTPTKSPIRTGFGNTLIEKGIPDASVTRDYLQDGLICTIEFPLTEPKHGAIPSTQGGASPTWVPDSRS